MVRAPADVGDALGVTRKLSQTAGDHNVLSFTLTLGCGGQIADCYSVSQGANVLDETI